MSNVIERLQLLNGISLNPIPLEVGQKETVTKWLMEIESKLNEIIIIRNEVIADANNYSNVKYNELLVKLNSLIEELNNGNIIPNGSIGLEKINPSFLKDINDIVIKDIHNVAKTVSFGIDDNGYFYATIPESWSEIKFSTDVDGRLILTY